MTRRPLGSARGRLPRPAVPPVALGGVEADSCALSGSQSDFPSKSTTEAFTQSERAFQGSVVRYARLMGWTVWHDEATNAPRRCRQCGTVGKFLRNVKGLPDLILVRRPRIVWAELKSERGRLTDEQRAWIEELRACGQEVHVWRPSLWQEVERVLR